MDYGNGTALTSIGRDGAGRETSLAWRLAAGTATTGMIADTVTRSRAGGILSDTVTDNGTTDPDGNHVGLVSR